MNETLGIERKRERQQPGFNFNLRIFMLHSKIFSNMKEATLPEEMEITSVSSDILNCEKTNLE
jgi:hypothetical protein